MTGAAAERDDLAELLDEVRRIEILSRRLVNDVMAGGYHSVFRGGGIEFDEVREYVPGDDPRSVDWNVTARMGRPYVKTYADEREQTVLILLDLSRSMEAGYGALSARRMAARVCACLALSAVRNDDKVGLVTFSDRVESHVPPRKGAGHVLRIVRDCLALQPTSSGTDHGPALDFVATVQRRRAVVFLVSDFLADPQQAARWTGTLSRCARRHDVVAVRLLPPEWAPPRAGLLHVRDPETGRTRWIDTGSAAVRAAWARRAARWRDASADALRRAGADLMDVPVPRTPDPDMVAGPILRFFRMREMRGRKR